MVSDTILLGEALTTMGTYWIANQAIPGRDPVDCWRLMVKTLMHLQTGCIRAGELTNLTNQGVYHRWVGVGSAIMTKESQLGDHWTGVLLSKVSWAKCTVSFLEQHGTDFSIEILVAFELFRMVLTPVLGQVLNASSENTTKGAVMFDHSAFLRV